MARDPQLDLSDDGRSVAIRAMPGDPITGLWCETCFLPSVISVPVYLLGGSGVTLHGYAEQCQACEGKPRLVRYTGEG